MEIELQTDVNRAGTALPGGAYLYTALVLRHRSCAHLAKRTTAVDFFNLQVGATIPRLMGTHVGHISRAYFAGVLSPRQVLQRHTLFGYMNLAFDKEEANYREEALFPDYVRLNFSIDRVEHLRWCKSCADEEKEAYGFASWKVAHQLPSVRICHVHGDPLLSLCRNCGDALGAVASLRLPGEACAKCRGSDFSGEDIEVRDAYRTLVRNIVIAFENQNDDFRYTSWNTQVLNFIASFPSFSDAHKALSEYLCGDWGVSSIKEIWRILQTPTPTRVTVFECGDRYLSVRILLCSAMRVIRPFLRNIPIDEADISLSYEDFGILDFASIVRQHARTLRISDRTSDALSKYHNAKDAAAAARLNYAATCGAWSKIITSMRLELSDEEIKGLQPE